MSPKTLRKLLKQPVVALYTEHETFIVSHGAQTPLQSLAAYQACKIACVSVLIRDGISMHAGYAM